MHWFGYYEKHLRISHNKSDANIVESYLKVNLIKNKGLFQLNILHISFYIVRNKTDFYAKLVNLKLNRMF